MVSIIPLSELKEKTLAMSAWFETQKDYPYSYGTTSGNHDGAGLSHGVLQYNFGTGSLNTLWRYMINTHPTVCEDAFLGDTARYEEWKAVVQDTVVANQVAWGESISTPKDGTPNDRHHVLEPWSTYFMNLGISQESIDKQVSMSNSWRTNADAWFNAIPEIWSRKAYALMWDISVQMGRFNPLAEVQAEFADQSNYVGMTENQAEQWRCERIAWHSAYNNAVSSINQPNVYKRKMCVATESGDWYGPVYDGKIFDMILEPAFANERTYTFPVIITLTEDNPRPFNAMSSAAGFNSMIINISFDKPIVKYMIIRGGTDRTTGVVLEEKDVSYTGGQIFQVTIDHLDLLPGDNVINVYGMGADGVWSDGVVPTPTTTISPLDTVQNTIPFTVTLTTDEVGAQIKYKLGTGATVYNYSAPFSVNQNSAGVASTNIKVSYWAVGSQGTELEKSITYNTIGATPGKSVLTVTNGENQVKLDWTATGNTTSYSVYRSTVSGTLGTVLTGAQYINALTWTDTTAVGGTTYYYTIQSGNYGSATNSDQKVAQPTTGVVTPTKPTVRYIRIDGYGEVVTGTANTNTRMIEVEMFSGGVNRLSGKTGTAGQAMSISGTAEIGTTTPTRITNGVKTITGSTYNAWWNSPVPNAFVKFDLGASYAIDSIRYWAYTARAPRFRIYGSANSADIPNTGTISDSFLIWDASLNDVLAGATAGTNNYIEMIY
jgi:hypothetical protein